MSGFLVGSDEANFRAVEAAIGRPVDVIRCYRWKGANHASLTALAAAGYTLWVSYKFRDNAGVPIPATTIPAHAIDADLDVFDQVMEGLRLAPARPGGGYGLAIHRKGYEHEEDAKAAAASGTPAALNAAVDYCIGRRKSQAVAAGLQSFVCWTGFDLLNREPLFRPSGLAADVIMLDPYELAPAGAWPSLVASYGQDFNYLRAVYGKPICLGEVNAPNTAGPGRQAAWLNQARADLTAQFPEVDGACLWQGGTLSETLAELQAMRSGFFAPPAPATVAVDAGKLASLKALAAAL